MLNIQSCCKDFTSASFESFDPSGADTRQTNFWCLKPTFLRSQPRLQKPPVASIGSLQNLTLVNILGTLLSIPTGWRVSSRHTNAQLLWPLEPNSIVHQPYQYLSQEIGTIANFTSQLFLNCFAIVLIYIFKWKINEVLHIPSTLRSRQLTHESFL